MRRTIVLLSVAVAAVVLLGGCSGTGAPAADARGAGVQTLAADNLSALVLFSEWTQALYPKTGGTPTINGPEPQPDGSLRFWGTNSDDSTFEWFAQPDGSSTGTLTWPDGLTFSQVADAILWSPDHRTRSTEHFVNTYPDGGRLECRVVAHYGSVTTSVWTGTATLKDGKTTGFVLQRALPGHDELTVPLEDGAQLEFSVPLSLHVGGLGPAFAGGATGALQSPGGRSLSFTASGLDDWAKWAIEGADGFTGEFALREDWSADGQLRQGGALAGALRWTEGFIGTLDLLGATQEHVTPSAAALNGGISRWCENVNALHPMPMY